MFKKNIVSEYFFEFFFNRYLMQYFIHFSSKKGNVIFWLMKKILKNFEKSYLLQNNYQAVITLFFHFKNKESKK
jgi:hypothetical protein